VRFKARRGKIFLETFRKSLFQVNFSARPHEETHRIAFAPSAPEASDGGEAEID
jgi:hypothetical protein